ncbi:MAG: restriction endonuclease subunit S [Candidatus Bipolaricaulia bacterium]
MTTRPESITPEQESVLGSVPEEWEVVQLEGLGHWGGGKTPRKSTQEYWNGETLWVSPKDMDGSVVQRTEDHVTQVAISEKNLTVYDPGSVMVVFRSGVLRHTFPVATCNRPFAVNQDMKVLTPGRRVNNEFAFHLIDHLGPVVLQKATKVGTTVESVDTDSFMSLSVGLPPLPEQRRIADVLDTVDAAIQETDSVIEKQEQVKTGLLQDLLTRGLDADGRLRDPEREPEVFWETELGITPKAWEVKQVGELAAHVSSGSTPKGGKKVYQQEGIPFIRSQNVWSDGLDLNDVALIPREIHEDMTRTQLQAHDVLLNITGASIGRCCVVPPWLGEANVNQHVCIVRLPQADSRDSHFLSRILACHIGQQQIKRLQAGGSREGLNYSQLKSFVVPWPSEKERRMIVKRVETARGKQDEEKAYRGKLQHLKTGLMQDLLTGRVRVPEAEACVDEVVV